MSAKLKWIYDMLLDDAQVPIEERYFKLSDKDLIQSINTLAEFYQAKQNRASSQELNKDKQITYMYADSLPDSLTQETK